jgi:hypothetical protein
MIQQQYMLPEDVFATVMNCKVTFAFTKYRTEPNCDITIFRNPQTDKVEHLNATGTLIFMLSKSEATIEKMVETLTLKYERDSSEARDTIMKDVFIFLRSLERRGIVQIVWPTKS